MFVPILLGLIKLVIGCCLLLPWIVVAIAVVAVLWFIIEAVAMFIG
jgi:hypothetical protein